MHILLHKNGTKKLKLTACSQKFHNKPIALLTNKIIHSKGGILMNLGEKLKNLRLSAKNTLKEQSKTLGVSLNSVYRWEHGLAVPRKSMLKTIADLYNVPLEWLLQEGTGETSFEHAAACPVNDVEPQFLSMFRELSDSNKYKVLGYIEHMCIEEYKKYRCINVQSI